MKKLSNSEKDKSKYFLFIIYWDPDDKRIFVPKRWGIGWTVNFANPLSIIVLIVTILVISFLSKFF